MQAFYNFLGSRLFRREMAFTVRCDSDSLLQRSWQQLRREGVVQYFTRGLLLERFSNRALFIGIN